MFKVFRSNPLWSALVVIGLALFLVAEACSPASGSGSEALVGVDETVNHSEEGLSGSVPIGSTLETTANLNFRTGPSSAYQVLRVLAEGTQVETVDQTSASNGYYRIKHNGTTGWAYGSYMTVVSTPSGGPAGVSGPVALGTVLETVTALNFRSGPSTSYGVLDVLSSGTQVEAVASSPQNGYYQVDYDGTIGWSHGGYMRVVGAASGDPTPPPANNKRDEAVARAQAGVGFSYWWGHARWLPSGPTSSSTAGSCSGSCPSCSHAGSYGADCSGYVGKIWQVPSDNDDLTYDWHPYSTSSFNGSSSLWTTVSRGSLQKADALVYNDGSSGHIVLYESGDGWGSMWAYECKGCAAGCVHNLRTASSSYKGIRRSGY